MTTLRATARLQFNKSFTFDDAVRILPYLSDLGISHIYASPVMAAREGSTHGYDVVDSNRINPEIGGYAALLRLSEGLRQRDMGLVIDIVPNHMAASFENPWWRDVLGHGHASRYGEFFDIDWDDPDPEIHGKVFLPCLGDTLDACLERDELRLETDPKTGRSLCRYFDQAFPVATDSGSKDLRELLAAQHYRLAFWREAAARINWRRFFDINQLVALRMERDEVFTAYHSLVLELVHDGVIDGVRVDHVDGLADPAGYCRRLRAALHDARGSRDIEPYIVLEKILEGDEALNRDWPVDGSTGYDFMNQVAAVLHDSRGGSTLSGFWRRHTGDGDSFPEVAHDARAEIVQRLFPKQLDRVLSLLRSETKVIAPPGGGDQQRRALIELLAALHRYRFYGDEKGFSDADDRLLNNAQHAASKRLPLEFHPALGWICNGLRNAAEPRMRFQQLSATLAAKAVEDTAFYRYGRLLSRNEVGADPGELAIEPLAFHGFCARRQADFPRSMLATATHDHKRGEDNRARLAVLSEIPEEWAGFVDRWAVGQRAPNSAIQLMIYQTILGAWPPSLAPSDGNGLANFHKRIAAWLLKALREAKQETSWENPNAAFEEACSAYLANLFDPARSGDFLAGAAAFVARIAPAGIVNSLSQVLLRLTAPGIPDLYQGTEFWDFSLVDPDNRGAVDFAARQEALAAPAQVDDLMRNWQDGRLKQWLITRMLQFRKQHDPLFAAGSYEPVVALGPASTHLIAFIRRYGSEAVLVLATRHGASFLGAGDPPRIGPSHWRDTVLQLPTDLRGMRPYDVLNDRPREHADVATLLSTLPVAVCRLAAM
jgi:malto-oligosyltrehalose synthase